MKSVGEVMSIGRTFWEALQKAARSLRDGQIRSQSLTDRVDYRVLAPKKQDIVRDLTNEAPPASKPRPTLPKAEDAELGVALRKVIQRPTAERLFYVGDALRRGISVEEVHAAHRHRPLVPGPAVAHRRARA